MLDTPAIASSSYGSNTSVFALNAGGARPLGHVAMGNDIRALVANAQADRDMHNIVNQLQQEKLPMASRRLVKVVIVDPNENVPLDNCILYSGEEKLTDATDQELFFEIDIKGILDKHNEKRVTFIDKKVKERTENLEPAKIRDLKMVVVNVATF
jgi:hypothetical protein